MEDSHNKKHDHGVLKIHVIEINRLVSCLDTDQTRMSVSFRMPSDALHGSLSMDERDQYNSESNDENLLYMEYINAAASSPPKAQSKYFRASIFFGDSIGSFFSLV